MIKRYCDMCDQQIDEGVHSWYVIELHRTDGEFRRKELCEECFASEINCLERPNRCETCRHWWKSEEVCLLDDCHYESETEPQKCYLRKSCDHYGDKQVCGRCREYNLYSHTKTESQTHLIDAPTIEPQRGEWLFKEITDDYHVIGQCSICKERRRIDNFCPNCGARMKGADDEVLRQL